MVYTSFKDVIFLSHVVDIEIYDQPDQNFIVLLRSNFRKRSVSNMYTYNDKIGIH